MFAYEPSILDLSTKLHLPCRAAMDIRPSPERAVAPQLLLSGASPLCFSHQLERACSAVPVCSQQQTLSEPPIHVPSQVIRPEYEGRTTVLMRGFCGPELQGGGVFPPCASVRASAGATPRSTCPAISKGRSALLSHPGTSHSLIFPTCSCLHCLLPSLPWAPVHFATHLPVSLTSKHPGSNLGRTS